jgi:hypothetical protein
MIKKTKEEFINQCMVKHNNFYDYSLVDYDGVAKPIVIICPIHGEFKQVAREHIKGAKCLKCSLTTRYDKVKITLTDFVERSNEIHNNFYDYSLVVYKNNRTKVKIICPIHGEFKQRPDSHLSGDICIKCYLDRNKKKYSDEFTIKANNVHNGFYDYSLVEYNNTINKVKIICPIHGEFEQSISSHLSSHGCRKCSIDKNNKKLKKNVYKLIDESNKIHNGFYDYSLVEYDKSINKVIIICPIHGEFKQSLNNHVSKKQNCPKCSIKYDKTENEIKKFIKSFDFDIIENSRKIINGKELDIYIPSHKIAIEFNGLYWHSDKYLPDNYHLNKTELCEERDIRLIHIFEDEWIYKQDIVKSRLNNILGLTKTKIYARKCQIKEITSKESRLFLDKNHIQGYSNAKVSLGLYYNNELISLMTFGGLRKNLGSNHIEGTYELIRFCNKLNTSVVGGANKLLQYFIKNYNPKEIISYADRRWSQGELYETLGFKEVHKTKPNFFYINGLTRLNRFNFRKDILVKQGYDPNKSGKVIMQERGINRIYDSGSIKYKLLIRN